MHTLIYTRNFIHIIPICHAHTLYEVPMLYISTEYMYVRSMRPGWFVSPPLQFRLLSFSSSYAVI